eukprot:1761160-Prymnesium_polylepis.3
MRPAARASSATACATASAGWPAHPATIFAMSFSARLPVTPSEKPSTTSPAATLNVSASPSSTLSEIHFPPAS